MLGYMVYCFIDFMFGVVVFYIFGFVLMFGGFKLVFGLEYGNFFIGWDGFFFSGRLYDV